MAVELAKRGHEVTVITPSADISDDFAKAHQLTIKDLGTPSWRIPNVATNSIAYLMSRVIARLLELLLNYPSIEYFFKVKKALKFESGYDALISIASPHSIHWGVAAVWNKHIAKKWIADCGDPYALLQNDTFKRWYHFRLVEKWFMKKVDYITIPIKEAKASYFEQYHSKIRVIPQGLSFPDMDSLPQRVVSQNHADKKVTFGYFGSVTPYQYYAKPFLKLLSNITMPFEFVIYTNNVDYFKKHIPNQALVNCKINTYTERFEVLKQMGEVDFLVYFPYRFNSQLSFKLIDYTFLKKPILIFNNTEYSVSSFLNFLVLEYDKSLPLLNLENYQVHNVAKQFERLIQ